MIYLDCTSISRMPDSRTGIQRVARSIAGEAIGLSTQVCAAAMSPDGRFYRLRKIPQYGDLPRIHEVEPIRFGPGDIYVVLDSNWVGHVLEKLSAFRSDGLTVGVVYYDLVPLTHSEISFVPRTIFLPWVEETARWADFFASISLSTQDALKEELPKICPARGIHDDVFFHFSLGADLPVVAVDSSAVRPALQEFFAGEKPYLMVGTVEPRKNHTLVLDAFDALWERFPAVKLCFVGHEGWMMDDVVRRIENHSQAGTRFQWVRDASDMEVAWAYQQAKCTLIPSLAEGFGLPLIESWRFGTPVLASDIPVFHELAGFRAGYFPPSDSNALASWIERIEVDGLPHELKPDAHFSWPTWKESAGVFLQKIRQAAAASQKYRTEMAVLSADSAAEPVEAEADALAYALAHKAGIPDLLRMTGRNLVRHAYIRFLHRFPDPADERTCLDMLADGMPPMGLLSQLRFSEEGQKAAEPVRCLWFFRFVATWWTAGGVSGKLFRYIASLLSIPTTHHMVRASLIHGEEMGRQQDVMRHAIQEHLDEIEVLKKNLLVKTEQISVLERSLQIKAAQLDDLLKAVQILQQN